MNAPIRSNATTSLTSSTTTAVGPRLLRWASEPTKRLTSAYSSRTRWAVITDVRRDSASLDNRGRGGSAGQRGRQHLAPQRARGVPTASRWIRPRRRDDAMLRWELKKRSLLLLSRHEHVMDVLLMVWWSSRLRPNNPSWSPLDYPRFDPPVRRRIVLIIRM